MLTAGQGTGSYRIMQKRPLKIAFALKEVTYVKSFMPLIRLWEPGSEIVVFVFRRNEKLTSPVRNREALRVLDPYETVWYETAADVVQGCRERGIPNLVSLEGEPFQDESNEDPGLNVIVITHMVDFTRTLPWFYDDVTHVLFHSRYMTEGLEFEDRDGKFHYTGYPQYLVLPSLDRQATLKKYGLPLDRPVVCILGPKKMFYRETYRVLRALRDYARKRGLFLAYKTRRKDRVSPYLWWLLRKDRYLYDVSYFPPTSLELIHASDLVINFDSTGIQEILMLEKKVVNFYTKHYRFMTGIYREESIPDLGLDIPREALFRVLDETCGADLADAMATLKSKYFMHEDEVRENLLRFKEQHLKP